MGLLVAVGACPGSGGGPPRGAAALLEAARQAEGRGRMAAARAAWQHLRAEAIRAGDGPALERAVVGLLRLEAEAGQPAALKAILEEGLAAAPLRRDPAAQARLHLAAVAAAERLGSLAEAAHHLTQAQGLAQRAKHRGLEACAVAGLAELGAIQGDFGTAVQRMAEATLLLGGLQGRALAPAALAAARAARRLMDLPRARRLAQQALRSYETRRERVAVTQALLELARIEEVAGDRRAATGWYEEAIRRLEGEGQRRGAALARWGFADVLEGWGETADAEGQRRRAREALAKQGDRDAVARLALATGRALARRGKHQDARVWLERAVTALEQLGDRFSAGQARILTAHTRVQLGESAEALGELTQALDHGAAVGAPELTFRAYALLGSISDTLLDRGAQAERFHRGAVTALEKVRSGLDPLRAGAAGAEEAAYYELARVAVKQWRRSGDPSLIDAVLAAVERARSRQLQDVFSRVGASLADSPADRRRVRSLAGQERFVAAALGRPGGTPALRRELFGRLRRVRAARAKIEAGAMRVDAARPTPVTVGILKQALGDQDVLLVYLVGRRGSLLLGLSNRDVQVVDLPGRAVLGRAVAAFGALVDGRTRPAPAAWRRAGAALRRHLLDPVAPLLKGRSRVQLVLSGPLWAVPFAALPDGAGRPLGARHAFLRVPSPAGWLKLRDSPRAQSATRALRVLALNEGALRAGRSPLRDALSALGHGLRPSPGALASGRALLAVAAPKARGGLMVDPLESTLRKDGLTDARWIHLATPVVLPARLQGPVQPALLVAGGDGPADDGLLLLRELLGLSLDAQLLSVAELDAGRGAPHVLAADGLARALQLAGVRSVLLPRVPGGVSTARASAAFLQAFYRRLAAGDDLARAQLAAHRALIKAHPGDPRGLALFTLYGAF